MATKRLTRHAAGAARFTLPHGFATAFGMSAISSPSSHTWSASRAWIHGEEAHFSVCMTLPAEPFHIVQRTAEAPSAIP